MDEVPERLVTRKQELIGELMRGHRESQGRSNLRGRVGFYRDYVRRLINGEIGVGPNVAYALGDALNEAGVGWASGLLFLSVSEIYTTHALGIAACILARGPTDDVQRLWRPLIHILNASTNSVEFKLQDVSRKDFALPSKSLSLVRSAWHRWNNTLESTADFPDIFRAYFALATTPVAGRISPEFFSLTQHARIQLNHWMLNVEHEWNKYGLGFAPLASNDRYIDSSDMISVSDLTPLASRDYDYEPEYAHGEAQD
ncbi:MAG: hypothetical protein WCE44_12650 [Candidatus Velthaea sp.]